MRRAAALASVAVAVVASVALAIAAPLPPLHDGGPGAADIPDAALGAADGAAAAAGAAGLAPLPDAWPYAMPAAHADHSAHHFIACDFVGADLFRVTSIRFTIPNGTYGIGEEIGIRVSVSHGFSAFGVPMTLLELRMNDTSRNATYSAHDPSAANGHVNYTYTVQAGDYSDDLGYAGTDSLYWNSYLGQAVARIATAVGEDEYNCRLPEPGTDGSLSNRSDVRVDALAPRAVSVSSPNSSGTYGIGSHVSIAVLFNEDVYVEGAPTLELATGGGGRNATYASGSGSPALAFNYTVRPGDRAADLDYAGAAALSLNGGTIKDAIGNNASLALPEPGAGGSLGHSGDILVKTAGPFVRHATSPDADGTYRTGRIVAIALNFTDPVTVQGTPRLELATDPVRYALYAGGSGTDALEFWYAVQPGDAAAALDYNDTASLSTGDAGASISALQGGAAADLELPAPGRQGSLAASKSIAVAGYPAPLLFPAASVAPQAYDGNPNGPFDVDVFKDGNRTYALVASQHGSALMLFRIPNGSALEHIETRRTGGGMLLDSPNDIDVFEMGNGTYALVASRGDRAVQLVRINASGTPAMSAPDGGNMVFRNPANNHLADTRGVSVFKLGGDNETHALVTLSTTDAVELIRIHENGTLSRVSRAAHGSDFAEFDSPQFPEVLEVGGNLHAIVAAYRSDAVHLIRIHANGTLEGISRATDTAPRGPVAGARATGPFPGLDGAHGIDVFEMDGRDYAIVASNIDDGVQLIRIHANGTLEGIASATRSGDFPSLDGARAVDTFRMAGATYAVAAAYDGDAVQLMRIHANGTLEGIASATHGRDGFGQLNNAWAVAPFDLAGAAYAAVVGEYSGVQLIRLSPASVANVSTSLPDGAYSAGQRLNVTVAFDGPVVVLSPHPSLLLALGGRNVAAEYLSGSGTAGLVFGYTVQPGDNAGGLEYAGPGALATRGIVADVNSSSTGLAAAYLELPPPGGPGSLGYQRNVRIDTPPSALRVGSPDGGGAYGADTAVNITVRFTEPVRVAGAPLLWLSTDPPRSAAYVAGSDGGAEIAFRYEVRDGDSADPLDYANSSALRLNGGTIVDANGNPAILTLPEPGKDGLLGRSGIIEIDAVPPYVVSVSSPNASSTYGPGSYINITVSFSEAVHVGGEPLLALGADAAGGARHAEYVSGSGTPVLSFNYTVLQGDSAARLDYAKHVGPVPQRRHHTGRGSQQGKPDPAPSRRSRLARPLERHRNRRRRACGPVRLVARRQRHARARRLD